jgi:hypothetical protein
MEWAPWTVHPTHLPALGVLGETNGGYRGAAASAGFCQFCPPSAVGGLGVGDQIRLKADRQQNHPDSGKGQTRAGDVPNRPRYHRPSERFMESHGRAIGCH